MTYPTQILTAQLVKLAAVRQYANQSMWILMIIVCSMNNFTMHVNIERLYVRIRCSIKKLKEWTFLAKMSSFMLHCLIEKCVPI